MPQKRILVQMTYLNAIGGIETALDTLSRTFKDSDITFLINSWQDGAQEQIKRLERYHKVILDQDRNGHHEADVALIYTPIMQSVPWDTIEAPKVYQFIHSDIKGYMSYDFGKDFKWTPNPKITKLISVSETARDSLKEALGLDSEVVPNIFNPAPDRVTFLFMGRSTAEKGLDKTLELMKRFDAAGKDYVLLIASLVDPYGPYWPEIRDNPRIIYLGSSIYNDVFYNAATYLVQLSSQESWCYTVREALAHKVPCIVSDIPELTKVIKDGENGYIYKDDMDIEKIFNVIPRVSGYHDDVDIRWIKVLKGRL